MSQTGSGTAEKTGAERVVATTERNLTGARINAFTIVTSDLEASVHFYSAFMNYAVAERGVVQPGVAIDDADVSGRQYVIMRHSGSEQGQLRFLEAPVGAVANRPRPGAHAWDKGFGAIECMTSDIEESYQLMVRAGIETLSPPAYYFYRICGG